MTPVLDTLAPDDIVRRRIRRDWRNDIAILGHGTLAAPIDGHDEGTTFVDIGCRSDVARQQAFISLAAFVANDETDWDTNWTVSPEPFAFRLRVYAPRLDAYSDDA